MSESLQVFRITIIMLGELCEWVYQTVALVKYVMDAYKISTNSADIFFFFIKKGGVLTFAIAI